MFYDLNVMNSSALGAAWRLANQMPGDTSAVGLKKMCSSLNRWVVSGRVSLRTSSVLVNGAARVYKEEAEKLYRDCIDLNMEMLHRYNRRPIDEENSDPNSAEENSRETIRRASDPIGNNHNRIRKTRNQRQKMTNDRNGTSGSEIRLSSKCIPSRSLTYTTKEIGVQTTKSFIMDKREKQKYRRKIPNIDESLPYGWIVIYDNVYRIPTKIICSNVNSDIKTL